LKMNLRNAVKSIFNGVKSFVTSAWREIGGYTATFSYFGNDMYANDTVRSCIRTLAEHTSKANIKVIRRSGNTIENVDKRLADLIQYRPNMYMNGKDFLAKIRTQYEIYNVVFIYIMRDETNKVVGLYPMPHARYEAVEAGGELYIKFNFSSGIVMVQPWRDLAVLRKDYNTSDIWGDSNDAILTSLELLTTTNDGMANAIKSTANLRGIVKSTKAMLTPDDVKRIQSTFVADYMNLTNTSGIAALDGTLTFEPVNITPQMANYKSMEELRMNIHRYFGVSPEMVLSKAEADEREAFYEAKIETFLLALSLELTYKIYSPRERGFGNEIMFEANRMAYMSMAQKLNLMQMVDRGAMTPNEWRQALNLAPVDGGDEPIRRLDTAPVNQVAEEVKDDKQGQTL